MSDDGDAGRAGAATQLPDAARGSRKLDGKFVSEAHREVFHYTSVGALRGMLETSTLWATRATHLNDSSEMLRLWPHLERALASHYEVGVDEHVARHPFKKPYPSAAGGAAEIARHDAWLFVGSVRAKLLGDRRSEGIAPPFVTSFTTHSGAGARHEYHRQHGMLSQWRGYAGADGVAIVFAPAGLEQLLRAEEARHHYWPVFFADAVYDDEAHLRSRFTALFDLLPAFARHVLDGQDDDVIQLMDAELAGQIAVAAGRLKHHAFREEGECRIVAAPTPTSMNDVLLAKGTDPQKRFKEIHQRDGRFGAVPYIKLFDGLGETLPITRVVVGPSRNQRAVLEEVRILVQKHGHAPETVQPSEIPYVGSA